MRKMHLETLKNRLQMGGLYAPTPRPRLRVVASMRQQNDPLIEDWFEKEHQQQPMTFKGFLVGCTALIFLVPCVLIYYMTVFIRFTVDRLFKH